LLLLIVAAVYVPILGHEFIYGDDHQVLSENPDFNPPTVDSLGQYWARPHLNFYVPIPYTIQWLIAHAAYEPDRGTGGTALAAGPFHAASLLAHLGSTLLAYLVLRRLVRVDWAAWLGAAVFALHPIQVESVAWASTFYTPLSGCFALLTIWAYLNYSDAKFGCAGESATPPARNAAAWYMVTLLCYALALLTKPSILLVPCVLAVIEIALRGRRWRDVALPLGAMLVLGAVPIAITTRAAQEAIGIYSPLWLRPLIALDAVAFYLWKMFLPTGLVFDYGRSPRWLEHSGMVVRLTWLAPAGVTALAALAWRRTRWPLVALAVFVLALAPMLGLSRFDYQRYSTVADRYAYFAMLAPAMLFAAAVSRWGSRGVAVLAGVVVVIALAATTAIQVTHWHDDDRFFAFVAARNPDSLLLRVRQAQQLAQQNRPTDALDAYDAALAIEPNQPRVLYNMGNICLQLNRLEEAIGYFQRAGDLSPNDSRIFSNLGIALAKSGRSGEALVALGRALEANPSDPNAHLNAAILLAQLGRYDDARQHYQEVIRLHGNVAAAERGLATLDQLPR
jgi:Flp pilus assembly protein TadD